jgi:hypothetical protein
MSVVPSIRAVKDHEWGVTANNAGCSERTGGSDQRVPCWFPSPWGEGRHTDERQRSPASRNQGVTRHEPNSPGFGFSRRRAGSLATAESGSNGDGSREETTGATMNFEQRLDRAIQRGRTAKDEQGREAAARRMSEEELRHLHSSARLDLVEHIDSGLRALADRFPGFTFSTVASDDGWGAKVTRDDVRLGQGSGNTVFSRMELLIRPFGTAHIIELTAKGTIRNREVLNRSHYQRLGQLDVASFTEQIDLWVLEYAERFASG